MSITREDTKAGTEAVTARDRAAYITDEMIEAGAGEVLGGSTFDHEERREMAHAIYLAMFAAAPTPPPAEGIVSELRHLVSLNEARNGGPYSGHAAQACVVAMEKAAGEIERLREALAKIATEAAGANKVISLSRDGAGSGRVKVATAMHRIAALANKEG